MTVNSVQNIKLYGRAPLSNSPEEIENSYKDCSSAANFRKVYIPNSDININRADPAAEGPKTYKFLTFTLASLRVDSVFLAEGCKYSEFLL
jgi:hypothetical protein